MMIQPKPGAMSKPIVVVGSYNVGLFIQGDRLPGKGETVLGHSFCEGPGGKGSNQALSAARLGGHVHLIGCVGADRYGHEACELYDRLGIDRRHLAIDPTIHSGISFVIIDRNGDNLIAVAPGANNRLTRQHIDQARELIRSAAVLACQLEGPLETTAYALATARSLGVTTFLDPAPACPLPDEVYRNTDIIAPNQSETEALTGNAVATLDDAVRAGHALLARGVGTAIVKLGERGAMLVAKSQTCHFPAVPVEAVDTTGAGDAFAGGLLVGLAEGKPLAEAMELAMRVAALAVTKVGVFDALPDRAEVDVLAAPRPIALYPTK